MKPRCSNQRNRALTLTEVLVVIAILAVLVVLFLPTFVSHHDGNQRINCISNLKQIGLAYRIWEGDHGDKFPMQTSVTNGGTMELANGNNAWINFSVMSNELSTPQILICPLDAKAVLARNFGSGFNNKNISYFVGLDVTNEMNPRAFLCGDDNFEIGGASIKSGLLTLFTNTPVAWDSSRHVLPHHFWMPAHFVGNIGLADGSAQQVSQGGLRQAIQQTGVATNRLAIP